MRFSVDVSPLGSGAAYHGDCEQNRAAPLGYSFNASVGRAALCHPCCTLLFLQSLCRWTEALCRFSFFSSASAHSDGSRSAARFCKIELSSKLPVHCFCPSLEEHSSPVSSFSKSQARRRRSGSKSLVRIAYADTLRVFWRVLIGVSDLKYVSSALGALSVDGRRQKLCFRENGAVGIEAEIRYGFGGDSKNMQRIGSTPRCKSWSFALDRCISIAWHAPL